MSEAIQTLMMLYDHWMRKRENPVVRAVYFHTGGITERVVRYRVACWIARELRPRRWFVDPALA